MWRLLAAVFALSACYPHVDPEDVYGAQLVCYPIGHPELVVAWSDEFLLTFDIAGGFVQVTGDVPIALECEVIPMGKMTYRPLLAGWRPRGDAIRRQH